MIRFVLVNEKKAPKMAIASGALPKAKKLNKKVIIVAAGSVALGTVILFSGLSGCFNNKKGEVNSNNAIATTGETSFYEGNPVVPTESTEPSEITVPIVDSGEEYKIDINNIASDYEKVVVSSFDADGIPEEYDILGAKQDGDRIIVNISGTEALDAELDNIILKDTDNSVEQTNGISSTIYNFDTATINNMGNMQSSNITAASYKTIDGVPYLLCTIDGVQSLIPFNDITLSAKINPEDITEASKQNAMDYYEILIATGTEVKNIDQFQWCNIIQMEDGTRLLDVCSKNVNNGEYTRYLTLESNCMFMGITDQIVSGDGITKLGNEGSTIDFNNWGDNFPAGINRDVIDSYISTDGFIYAYIDRGKESNYLLYKIPANKVAFLKSNENIPVGSTKTDLSQYPSFSTGKEDFSDKKLSEETAYMFNVDGCIFYNLFNNSKYNANNIVLNSNYKTIEEINANYSKTEGNLDFSFSQLGTVVSDRVNFMDCKITEYKYVTYKEITIADQQFYSIIYYIEITDSFGDNGKYYMELLASKDSVTIKATESTLVLTKQ